MCVYIYTYIYLHMHTRSIAMPDGHGQAGHHDRIRVSRSRPSGSQQRLPAQVAACSCFKVCWHLWSVVERMHMLSAHAFRLANAQFDKHSDSKCLQICMVYVCAKHTYSCMHVCMYVCMYMYIHACMHAYMYVCIYTHIFIYACLYVCKCVACVFMYMYMYVCVYTYIHTYIHTYMQHTYNGIYL